MDERVLKINLRQNNVIVYEILKYSMKLYSNYIIDIQRFTETDSFIC